MLKKALKKLLRQPQLQLLNQLPRQLQLRPLRQLQLQLLRSQRLITVYQYWPCQGYGSTHANKGLILRKLPGLVTTAKFSRLILMPLRTVVALLPLRQLQLLRQRLLRIRWQQQRLRQLLPQTGQNMLKRCQLCGRLRLRQ